MQEDLPERKILVRLAYQAQAVVDAVKLLSNFLISKAAESLCLASAYINLDDRGWRLHTRIADYTTLDFYAWSTEHALKALKENRLIEALQERIQRVAEDEKDIGGLNRERKESS